MILVVGATGFVGGEVCRLLAGQGKAVRALVRPGSAAEKVRSLQELTTIEIATGDLKDAGSLESACRGVTSVISTASSTVSRRSGDDLRTVDLEGQLALLEAAQSAGVRQLVYVSFTGRIVSDDPLTTAKRTVEQRLRDSGLTFTILRPSFFMEVWLGPHLGFDPANGRVRIYGDGRNPISFISLFDVARFAALSVDHPAARNAVLELGGPEALSPLQVVEIFESLGRRKIALEFVPVEALQAQRSNATDPMQQAFAALMLAFAHGDPIDMSATLRAMPIDLVSVREYARRIIA
jgi:NADH dehydrogenase